MKILFPALRRLERDGLTKGKRHMRSRQHRAVVQSISHHGYFAPLRLQIPQKGGLQLGQFLGQCRS